MANVAGLDAFKQIHDTIKKATGKKLKVGIIGTGWIAESHAAKQRRSPKNSVSRTHASTRVISRCSKTKKTLTA